MNPPSVTAARPRAAFSTKVCPRCGNHVFEDQDSCLRCLYEFPSTPNPPAVEETGVTDHVPPSPSPYPPAAPPSAAAVPVSAPASAPFPTPPSTAPRHLGQTAGRSPVTERALQEEPTIPLASPEGEYGSPVWESSEEDLPLESSLSWSPEDFLEVEPVFDDESRVPDALIDRFSEDVPAQSLEDRTSEVPAPVTSGSSPVIRISWRGLTAETPFPEHGLTIGRAQDNDLVLLCRSVSRHHLRIEPSRHGPLLIDLGATNPALLNGVPLTGEAVWEPFEELDVCGARLVLLE